MEGVVGGGDKRKMPAAFGAVPSTKKAKPSEQKVASQTESGSPSWKATSARHPVWHLEQFNSFSTEKQADTLENQGPFCIAENITLKQFHAKCDTLESGGCFRWEFKDGKAWIYEIPHAAHEETAGRVIQLITLGLGQNALDLATSASPRCDDNTAHLSMEPDGAVEVRGHRPGAGHPDAADVSGNRWPNVIVEVAFCESEAHVRNKAKVWLNTTTNPSYGVQQVIVIKIGASVRVDGHRTMKAWRYKRGAPVNPAQTIEFGNHGPNHGATSVNLPGMQLQIPLAGIYHPAPVPADLVTVANILIDLFHIRQIIEEAF